MYIYIYRERDIYLSTTATARAAARARIRNLPPSPLVIIIIIIIYVVYYCFISIKLVYLSLLVISIAMFNVLFDVMFFLNVLLAAVFVGSRACSLHARLVCFRSWDYLRIFSCVIRNLSAEIGFYHFRGRRGEGAADAWGVSLDSCCQHGYTAQLTIAMPAE